MQNLQAPGLVAYLLTVSALLGGVAASFAGCLASRLTSGEDFIHGRSHCDVCGHILQPLDLIPVFSWLFLRGRCRYCGAVIPPSGFVTEFLDAFLFALLAWQFGVSRQTLEYWILTTLLTAVALLDWHTGFIDDRLLLAMGLNFVLFAGVGGQFEAALVRGFWGGASLAVPLLALVLVMDKVLGRESMGGGDIKLFFAVGLYFSWREALFILILSCLLGIGLAVGTGKTTDDPENPKAVPFGPAIAAAAALSLLFAEPVTRWYLSLF